MPLRPSASVAVRKEDEPAPGWHLHARHGGRRAGVRNRLAAKAFEDIFAHWCEPAVPGATHCKGEAALELFYRQKPGDYLRLVASVLLREFVFESAIAELDDEGLDEMLLALRQRMTEVRTLTLVPARDDEALSLPLRSLSVRSLG
jgi:hypothetical protein